MFSRWSIVLKYTIMLMLTKGSTVDTTVCVRNLYIQVSQEECARLRKGVPYVKIYR